MERLSSWVEIAPKSDFSIHNIPFGIFSTGGSKQLGAAIGEQVLDLAAVAELGLFSDADIDPGIFKQDYLNDFMALGKDTTSGIRKTIQHLLSDDSSALKTSRALTKRSEVQLHLPVKVGDYTDFYSSIEHATNVGSMFRDPDNALLPNWRHLPVGYHGRASSIIETGVPIHRPKGQVKPKDGPPVFDASRQLDFELEMAFIIGRSTQLGSSIPTDLAEEYIFGKVLFNDWSARDIQRWEYVPLGPFLAKNFASSISPWVVTMEALEPFRTSGPDQTPEVLPYLHYTGKKNYDINLEVGLTPDGSEETIVSKSNFKYMYWNMSQQLAHHTANGCPVNVGDMMASGTISGKEPSSYGSMLELSWAGSKPVVLNDGSKRIFIDDLDTVSMRGFAENHDGRVGFGEVTTQVLPSI